MYCFSYRDIIHSGSFTMEQPWIDEVSLTNPYTYNITMNRRTAEEKGLKEGDLIEVESRLRTQGCRPAEADGRASPTGDRHRCLRRPLGERPADC